MNSHYDVIIIGGRNAGASLAIRLSKHNLNVLLVDRANFPSLPAVPSSPMIHAGTMRLLDELGLEESTYANPDAKIEAYVLNFINHFDAVMPTSLMNIDRNYGYGIDRNKFDTILWETAAKSPNITAISNFTISKILQDTSGKVTGIIGKEANGKEEEISCELLVGADGRFSWTATKVGAKAVEERNEYMGSSYHAEWENVEPYSQEHLHTAAIYNTANGFFVIVIPIDTRKYIIGTYLTADKVNFGAQKAEATYLEGVMSIPAVAERLKNAKRTTDVVGVKNIQNGYRQAFGNAWALAGDAVHYKDPVDGQGIYDALLGTKLLAQAIHMWKIQGCSFQESMQFYQDELMKATHPMFLQTVARIKQEAYTNPPSFIINSLIRWTLTDPEYQAGFLRYLHRAIDPSERPNPDLSYILRGIKRDLFGK